HLAAEQVERDRFGWMFLYPVRKLFELFTDKRDTGNSQRSAVPEEDFRERLGEDRFDAPSHEGLGGMFTRRTTAKIPARDKYRSILKFRTVERVVGIL